MKEYVNTIGYLIGTIMLVGCAAISDTLPVGNDVISVPASATISSSMEEIAPSPTITPTEAINQPTPPPPTAMPTIQPAVTPSPPRETPTPVPFPTFDIAYSELTEEAATQNLIDLLETNRGCELPCWWGITLGETNVNSLEAIFVPLGFDWNKEFETLNGNTFYRDYIDFTSDIGIVQSIEVRGGATEETYDRNEAWRPYAIPRVLERLSLPENVYVYYPFRFDPGGMQAYRLFMYYPDLGVEIDYLGKASLNGDRSGWAQACPNILETDEINLFLFQPGTVPDYLERTLPELSLPLPKLAEGINPYDLVSWEQATESSLDAFWRLFTESDEGTVCFEFKTYWTGD
ncbi:hypothetical protein MNBD_CHLOROFLEXI01-1016 [hydrothermal vent metagenome]|uniref:Uncharacterized protein n=1 Tax=hydrothermal vent metagenome TaxID=652676 RepID=A0A3B0W1X3_9ZZZZ